MMRNNHINLYLNYDSSLDKCANFACFICPCLIKEKINGSLTM